jgi:transposase
VKERDPVKMLELVLGIPDVRILGVESTTRHIRIELESTRDGARCSRCGSEAVLVGTRVEEMVDLPIMGTPPRLLVNRRRFECPSPTCGAKRWFEPHPVKEFNPSER